MLCLAFRCDANQAVIDELRSLEKAGHYEQALAKIEQFQQHQDDTVRYASLLIKAMIHRKQGNHAKSISTLQFMEQSFYLTDNRKYHIYKELGINLRRQSKLEQAEQNYLQALAIAQALEDQEKIAQTYNNLGVVAENRELLAQALHYHMQAYEMLKHSDDHEKRGANFYNLGDISLQLGDLDNAEYFFSEALIADKASKEVRNIAGTALRLAELKFRNKKYQAANTQIDEAIDYLKQIGANAALSRAYRTAALVARQQQRLDIALTYAQAGLKAAQTTDSHIQRFYANLTVLEIYIARQETEHTAALITELDKITTKETADTLLERYYYAKAQALAMTKQHSQAYELMYSVANLQRQNNEVLLQKRINSYKKSLDALVQQQKLDQAKSEQALTLVNLENAQLSRKLWVIAALAILFAALMVIGFFVFKHRNATLQAKMYQHNIEHKDKMLADISHELRTPLSVLKLHIEAMEHNLIDDDTLAYAKINNKIDQLNQLIANVYQLSQADHDALKLSEQQHCGRTVINSYVYDVERLVSSYQLQFIADIQADDISLYIDKPKLDRVIDNLAKNACLYTDKPGKVRLKIRLNTQGLFIQMDDSAPGVPEAEQMKLFERLYRVESSRSRATGGSGLGLSICQSLITAMTGSVSVKTGKMGGLCIRIELPKAVTSEALRAS